MANAKKYEVQKVRTRQNKIKRLKEMLSVALGPHADLLIARLKFWENQK